MFTYILSILLSIVLNTATPATANFDDPNTPTEVNDGDPNQDTEIIIQDGIGG